ncbi:MAG: hypothetical protein JJ976_11680 [Rhodothermales bacterium]|nr:hypothetical protein [Rhodothermales bacterium]
MVDRPAGTQVLAEFRAATSVSASTDGEILVADAGRLFLVGPAGPIPAQTPSPGVAAVDAGLALSRYVAHPDGGIVDRLGHDGNLILRFAVPAGANAFRDNASVRSDGTATESGRPVDVVVLSDGSVVALEASRPALLIWDRAGRADRVLTTFRGIRMEPKALARQGDGFAVLDANSSVYVFDEFANELDVHSAQGATALGAELWVAGQQRAWRLTESEGGIAAPEGVVDLEVTGGALLLLTPRALIRQSID